MVYHQQVEKIVSHKNNMMINLQLIIWLWLTRTGNYRMHGFDYSRDFPIYTGIWTSYILHWKKLQTKIQKFLLKISMHQKCQKGLIRKKSKEGNQTLADLSSVHWHSQAKCLLVQTSDIKQKNPCFSYNEHLINQI